jgi:mRNA deadenylase 3'-5' endonuclease subunit Ccr4
MPISLISYNVLADSYIKPSFYPKVERSLLLPEFRIPFLLRRIHETLADVMCLQEVEPSVFSFLKTSLEPLGYFSCFCQKKNKPDGCATFVSRHLMTTAIDSLFFQDGNGIEPDSGHLAQILHVEGASGKIGIANTHFKWDPPNQSKTEKYGLRQASQLLSHLSSLEPERTAWVVCGDFNAEPYGDIAMLFNDYGFIDAYRNQNAMCTCASNQKARRIDFIVHSKTLCSQPLAIAPIDDSTSLPSEIEPSDHLSIGALINLRRE